MELFPCKFIYVSQKIACTAVFILLILSILLPLLLWHEAYVMAELIEALHYKTEGHEFDS